MNPTTTPAHVNGNGHTINGHTPQNGQSHESHSAIDLALTLADNARNELRAALSSITELSASLKQVAREHRGRLREVESARQTLSQLQKVRI